MLQQVREEIVLVDDNSEGTTPRHHMRKEKEVSNLLTVTDWSISYAVTINMAGQGTRSDIAVALLCASRLKKSGVLNYDDYGIMKTLICLQDDELLSAVRNFGTTHDIHGLLGPVKRWKERVNVELPSSGDDDKGANNGDDATGYTDDEFCSDQEEDGDGDEDDEDDTSNELVRKELHHRRSELVKLMEANRAHLSSLRSLRAEAEAQWRKAAAEDEAEEEERGGGAGRTVRGAWQAPGENEKWEVEVEGGGWRPVSGFGEANESDRVENQDDGSEEGEEEEEEGDEDDEEEEEDEDEEEEEEGEEEEGSDFESDGGEGGDEELSDSEVNVSIIVEQLGMSRARAELLLDAHGGDLVNTLLSRLTPHKK